MNIGPVERKQQSYRQIRAVRAEQVTVIYRLH